MSDSPIMHWLSWCHIKWPRFWSCWLVHGDCVSCLGEISSWDQFQNKRRPTWNLKQPLQSVVSVALFKSFTWEIVVSPNNHLKWMFQVLVSGHQQTLMSEFQQDWYYELHRNCPTFTGSKNIRVFVWGSPMIWEGRDYSGSLKIHRRSVVWVNFRGWWKYPFWVGIIRDPVLKSLSINQYFMGFSLCFPFAFPRPRESQYHGAAGCAIFCRAPQSLGDERGSKATLSSISSWLERPGSFATSEEGGLWPFGHGCVALSCHGSCKPRFGDWRRRCCSGSRSTAAANWVPSHHQGVQASVLIALAGFDFDREGTHDVKGFLFSWFFSSFYTLILYPVSFLSPNVSEKLA